jgi:CheY-like chemotaxis protein
LARKILLADDSVTAQNMGRKILADAGYEVITVNNGSAALKRIAEAKPDLIVLDVYMPGYSGLEVCQRLKDANDTARIPVLLTVGKLEPFKPEEARRVRAEGFIVKPFEASELLSALTKLEDKIVPRADSSKPGRFARAIAAVEEGRYDKTVAIDEDSGWRSRISFPKKKKEKPVEPEDSDDPAIYNAVNRDLKTVVDHREEHAPEPVIQPPVVQSAVEPASQPQDGHVDLGALVAHGLPKDVTPEEIAALAAAAAQVQGITESAESNAVKAAPASTPEFRQEEAKKSEAASTAQTEPAQVGSGELKSEPSVAPATTAPVTEKVEIPVAAASFETIAEDAEKVQARETPNDPVANSQKDSNEVAASFAAEEQKKQEDAAAEAKINEIAKQEAGSSATEAVPPIASFASADAAADSANVASATVAETIAEPEPAMAMAAAAHAASASRWTAVGVALAPEEASISLEEEMRQAQAVVAAASSPQSLPVPVEDRAIKEPAEIDDKAAAAESHPTEPEAAQEAPQEAPTPISTAPETTKVETTEVETSAPQTVAPEMVQEEAPPFVTASAAPVVKEFEAVTPREPEASVAGVETPVESESTAAPVTAEATEAPSAATSIADSPAEDEQLESPGTSVVHDMAPEAVSSQTVDEVPDSEKETAIEPDSKVESTAIAEGTPADKPELEAVERAESPVTQVPETQNSQKSAEQAAVAARDEISGGPSDMAKKESEIAATTAAAWASWRRIRQTDGKGAEHAAEKESGHTSERDEAAMAVAAGAEKAPKEGSDNSEISPEIASIVDSVLADLRPKIVEEISRKLNKKK